MGLVWGKKYNGWRMYSNDKRKKQMIKGVNCFERKIQRDHSSCTRLSKIKNVIRRISIR